MKKYTVVDKIYSKKIAIETSSEINPFDVLSMDYKYYVLSIDEPRRIIYVERITGKEIPIFFYEEMMQ